MPLKKKTKLIFLSPTHSSHFSPEQVILPTHFSMAETCFVSIFPFVRSSGVIRPSNSSPSLAILTRMSRTSSPMYIPLAIFSNLSRDRDTGALLDDASWTQLVIPPSLQRPTVELKCCSWLLGCSFGIACTAMFTV